MPETNFLTPIQEPENPPAGGKKPRKSAQGGSASGGKTIQRRKKADQPPLKNNLNVRLALPRAKFKVEARASGEKKSQAGNIYRRIAFSFAALTVILAAAALYFGLAKVTLVIIPAQEKIIDSLAVGIVDQANNSVMSQGEIQGVVRQAPVELSRIFTASGKEVLGEEVTGKVAIINNYVKNQPLVATTRLLSSDQKLFRLKKTVNAPAGGRVEAEVYADEPSPEMAIGPSRFTLPGLWTGLQDKIYGESRAPMKYSEKIKQVIKQSDIDNAVAELKKDLLAKTKKEAALAYGEYDQIILQADNNSVKLEPSGKVGEEKEKFTVKMKILVTVVAFKTDDVLEPAERKLAAALADDREIIEFNRSEMAYALANLDLSQAAATVNVNFTAKAALKDSAGIIKKNNLAGLRLEQVKAYLNGLPQVAGYEIKFFPSFIKKMPKLADRIEIVIKR